MANTFTSLHIHLVFSTKDRACVLTGPVSELLWPYLGGIAKDLHMAPLAIGGMADHVHMLVGFPTTLTVGDAVRELKAGSSRWLATDRGMGGFRWQDGYAAFSVSRSQVAKTIRYIDAQLEHHQGMDFATEFRMLLERHEIAFEEKYLLG